MTKAECRMTGRFSERKNNFPAQVRSDTEFRSVKLNAFFHHPRN